MCTSYSIAILIALSSFSLGLDEGGFAALTSFTNDTEFLEVAQTSFLFCNQFRPDAANDLSPEQDTVYIFSCFLPATRLFCALRSSGERAAALATALPLPPTTVPPTVSTTP